jgi:hypothetical protein
MLDPSVLPRRGSVRPSREETSVFSGDASPRCSPRRRVSVFAAYRLSAVVRPESPHLLAAARFGLLSVLLVLAAAPRAVAQPARPAASDSLSRLMRSESTALTLSLAATLVPAPTLILTVPGLIFGPSTGYFYGGCPRQAWRGIAVRTTIGIGTLALLPLFEDADGPFYLCTSLAAASAIYDIAKVRRTVRERNRRIAELGIVAGRPQAREFPFVPKSETKAFRYSIVGTLLPIGMGFVLQGLTGNTDYAGLAYPGILVGPSLGYFYAGSPARAIGGIGIRCVALSAGLLFGFAVSEGGDASDGEVAVVVSLFGLVAADAVYDVAHVRAHVRKKNREGLDGASLNIVPLYLADRNASGVGLRVEW